MGAFETAAEADPETMTVDHDGIVMTAIRATTIVAADAHVLPQTTDTTDHEKADVQSGIVMKSQEETVNERDRRAEAENLPKHPNHS